ncbi:MAG: UDP-2,4-diacetamido-2,4, 6-trideoxy-beta-L-altropyranose hydrolase [Clostridiaceae bacterium]|jgi:UDP-2,4-diacetamido-2,4,6-trideoxy-beta-L-altropyranose hydrolase|nr:UDP-2,4-diacetamido-2,4, 6-trideoxy-beta-L-altropyranose hydrolase [Clostridiaceae bacterium]
MKIAIRADGGSKIGMGHIMRTLVLAKELFKNNDIFYICRVDTPLSDKYKIGIEKIKSEGFPVREIREDFILADMKNISADLLITDSYDVDEIYFDETAKMFNKTAYIDDMNFCNYNVDFLINQNINADDLNYNVYNGTRLLLGTKYLMLRNEFRSIPEKYIKEKPQDIMITVGGGDPFHITEQILDYVNLLDYNFHVIIGPSFSKNADFKKYEGGHIKLCYNADMHEIMNKCDVAVSACGSTLYELAACGVPALGVIVADNQQGIANKMNELGVIKCAGWYNKLSKDTFVNALNHLCEDFYERSKMSAKARIVVDGNGVDRIVEQLMKQ